MRCPRKVSIVAEGGGMRGAYSLGAIDALFSYFGLKHVDYVCGSSASTPTLAYYTSGQFNPVISVWTNEISTKKVLSMRNLLSGDRILNIDYLIDKVIKTKYPLDIQKFKNSKTKMFIPLTNSETGEVDYFNSKMENIDFVEVLRAAIALPIFYGKNININGKFYFDGGCIDAIPIDIPEIHNSRKIIILSKSKDYPIRPSKSELIFREFLRPFLKKGVYNGMKMKYPFYKKRLKEIFELEKQGDILIMPNKKFSRLDNSKDNLEECIYNGRKDIISNPKINDLLLSLKKSSKRKFYFSD